MTPRSETDTDAPITPDERDALFDGLSDHPLALCVSGGADSMALMHLVAEWRDAGGHRGRYPIENPYDLPRRRDPRPERLPRVSWLEGFETREALAAAGGPAPIVVLTVDHGLRPEAAAEARFVAEHATRFGFPYQTLTAGEPPPATGIQEWARNLRRRLILELLDAEAWRLFDMSAVGDGGFERLAVSAHHLEDQAETVLMRLARGSGASGLGGMSPWADMCTGTARGRPYSISAALVRPFLDIPKSRLVASLRSREANWLEDPSNADSRFERVRMRRALSVLDDVGVSAAAICLSARRLRDTEVSFEGLWRRWARGVLELHRGLHAEVRYDGLGRRGPYAVVRLLHQLLVSYSGSGRRAGLSQVEGLYEAMIADDPPFTGATLGSCRVELVGTSCDRRLLIYREGNGEGLGTVPIQPGEAVEWDGGRFDVEADEAANGPSEVRALGAQGWARLKREVDGLDELKLKAAAMATLPAIWRGEQIVSVPWLKAHMARDDTRPKAVRNWAAWCGPEAHLFRARFCGQSAFDTSGGQD